MKEKMKEKIKGKIKGKKKGKILNHQPDRSIDRWSHTQVSLFFLKPIGSTLYLIFIWAEPHLHHREKKERRKEVTCGQTWGWEKRSAIIATENHDRIKGLRGVEERTRWPAWDTRNVVAQVTTVDLPYLRLDFQPRDRSFFFAWNSGES